MITPHNQLMTFVLSNLCRKANGYIPLLSTSTYSYYL